MLNNQIHKKIKLKNAVKSQTGVTLNIKFLMEIIYLMNYC